MKAFWSFIKKIFSNHIGIDLGTVNTLVYTKDEGIIVREPSVVAINAQNGRVLAIGEGAKQMIGKTPQQINAIRPLKDGVIANFEATRQMVRYFILKAQRRSTLLRPVVVVGVPSGITQVERRAVKESVEQAGAREVYLVEESMAAALGADVEIESACGHMIVDIGGGTTEVAVVSLGGLVVSNTIRIAGDEMDEAIIQYVKRKHGLFIGQPTAENIKIKIGSAWEGYLKDAKLEVSGRDVVLGLPKTITLSSSYVCEALRECVNAIVETVVQTLEQTPPELSSDIMQGGIMMVGGGALLHGMDKLLSKQTGLSVKIAKNPLECVVLGTGKCLQNSYYLRTICKKS
jgi:rod shape-determining protein MreB